MKNYLQWLVILLRKAFHLFCRLGPLFLMDSSLGICREIWSSLFQVEYFANALLQMYPLEFFLNRVKLSSNLVNPANSGKLINHWSMNWSQFNDPLCYLRLPGAVLPPISLTQGVVGSNPIWQVPNHLQFSLKSDISRPELTCGNNKYSDFNATGCK